MQPNTITPELKTFIAHCRAMEVPENLMLAIIGICSDSLLMEIVLWSVNVYRRTGNKPNKRDLHENMISVALKARQDCK